MNENKNVIIALVLMLAVWMGFTLLFPPQQSSQPSSGEQAALSEEVETAKSTNSNISAPVDEAGPQTDTNQITTTPPSEIETTQAADRTISIDTSLYTAEFSSSGARLTSFKLKEYQNAADPQSPQVQLINADSLRYATLQTVGTEGFALARDASYEVDLTSDSIELSDGGKKTLQFRSITPSGLEITKTFIIQDGHYSIDFATRVRNLATAPLTGDLELSLVKYWDDDADRPAYSFAGPVTLVGNDLEKVKVKKLDEETPTYTENIVWTSIQSKYFLDVIVPLQDSADQVRLSRENDLIRNTLETGFFTLQPGGAQQFEYFLFFGPKELDILKAENHQLEKAIDFGFFQILSKPLLQVLTFFYGFLHNYGLAIILLTIIIKILFWPLTHKSYASMKSMQKLQPEMQKLRERFKSDKERLNKELMALYKEHRVNPMGGCLPMLVQIPVFIALYKVLLDSIALRHAPFAFWLTDLSAKDPYYITPLLMGASMFVQQKLTPVSGDPMQAKIMTFLPVVFTFMFLNFPSGLVIYWLVNNLLTIVQQYYIHRKA